MSNGKNIDVDNIINETPIDLGVTIGNKESKNRIILFLNTACPGSKKIFERFKDTLLEQSNAENIYVQILFWNKPNLKLVNGNITHHYLNWKDDSSISIINDIFINQEKLNSFKKESEVISYLSNEYKLNHQDNQYNLDLINKIAIDSNLTTVPTILVNNDVFVGSKSIELNDLKQLISI